MMAARPPVEVTRANEARAWELRQRCWTEELIAAELGIHVSTVSRMLDRVERRLAEQLAEHALPIKARQTAQLERVAAEAFAAWEKSKLSAELERTVTEEVELLVGEDEERSVTVPAVKIKTTQERKGQTGDPALLEKAMRALADIRAIWGLDAARDGPPPSAPEGVGSIIIREVVINLPAPDSGPESAPAVAMGLLERGGD